ncbi:MAG: NTP transferase domain-containing protein [Candidatus Pacearchaeota archaeon]|nr:NTP transferase domain-containing protein [Candidatus Pacearchaeota archaeon]
MERKVDAVILAAGSLGREQLFPKALIEINGKSILQRQIEWLRPYVKRIIVACTESEARQIKRYHPGIDVVFATTPELPGSAGSLRKAIELITTDEFIVVNVDDLTDIDIASLINFGTNTVCVANPVLHYGVIEVENQEVKNFREKPILKNLWANCGVYFLSKTIAEKLPEKGNLARDVLPYIALRAYKHFGSWQPVWKSRTVVK